MSIHRETAGEPTVAVNAVIAELERRAERAADWRSSFQLPTTQDRAIDSYMAMRDAARARGDRSEPIDSNVTFTIVGRRVDPGEM